MFEIVSVRCLKLNGKFYFNLIRRNKIMINSQRPEYDDTNEEEGTAALLN
jgi:hypothetical protein